MKKKNKSFLIVIGLTLAAAMLACQLGSPQAAPVQATPPPLSAERTPTQVQSKPASPTEAPQQAAPTSPPPTEAPPSPTEAPPPAPTAESPTPCGEQVCIQAGTFLLQRPVGQGGRMTYDTANRYGEYQRSTRDANMGSDFLNSTRCAGGSRSGRKGDRRRRRQPDGILPAAQRIRQPGDPGAQPAGHLPAGLYPVRPPLGGAGERG